MGVLVLFEEECWVFDNNMYCGFFFFVFVCFCVCVCGVVWCGVV